MSMSERRRDDRPRDRSGPNSPPRSDDTAWMLAILSGLVLGKVYASPSGAARAVTGTAAENGWVWWRVRSSDKTLRDLRPSA